MDDKHSLPTSLSLPVQPFSQPFSPLSFERKEIPSAISSSILPTFSISHPPTTTTTASSSASTTSSIPDAIAYRTPANLGLKKPPSHPPMSYLQKGPSRTSIVGAGAFAPSSVAMESKKPLDINSLMSPPEPTPYDHFQQGHSSQSSIHVNPQAPMSPPVSPPSAATDHRTSQALAPASIPVKDPILFPAQDSALAQSEPPLFASVEVDDEHRRLVDRHVASRPSGLFRAASPPNREDYELALYFKSQVMRHYVSDPRRWLKKEREQLVADRKAGAKRKMTKYTSILPAKAPLLLGVPSFPRPRAPRPEKVGKPSTPRPIRTNPNPARQAAGTNQGSEPRRVVAPNREDKDFAALPDYCPPISSLPAKPNSLKVDWKGAPIDLSNDPHARLLHPDEVSLAANLRLDCATYLTSKRRIFIRRLECAKVGKEFRKTDAQQACKIDVNKASKLWTAFEKVGWLDASWVNRPL